jgi:arylformamidase
MDLQAEYDNGAKVPTYPAIAERWLAEAAAFRATHPHSELAIPYGPTERQALDLFWPGPARSGPVAVFIHGGYWQRSHRHAFSHLAAGLLAHNVAVAMPSYDLCPAVTLAELVEQVRSAIAFLHHRLGGRFLVTGHSAGGHLAAMAMATDWRARGLPADLVPAAMPISGLFDLEPITRTTVIAPLALTPAEAHHQSPMFFPPPGGRLHAWVGGEEGSEYTRQSRQMAEAWGGTWASLPGLHHFSVVEELANPGSTMIQKAISLIPGR